MKRTKEMVAIDTNSAIFLCEATAGNYHPKEDKDINIRPERVAMFRIYLYMVEILRLPPTVRKQIILHDQKTISLVLLQEISPNNLEQQKVEQLSKNFEQYHEDPLDCRILAEAENGSCDYLLTFDQKLSKKLRNQTKVKILTPSEFWESNSPPLESRPEILPHWSNPKAQQNWYYR